MLDSIYIRLRKKNNGVGTPEMRYVTCSLFLNNDDGDSFWFTLRRMPLMMLTSVFVPVGLIIYGWTADKHVFWLVPDIGIGIFAFGTPTSM